MRLHYWVALAALLIWIVFSDCPSFHFLQKWLGIFKLYTVVTRYFCNTYRHFLWWFCYMNTTTAVVMSCLVIFSNGYLIRTRRWRESECVLSLENIFFGNSNETETTYAVIIIMLTLWDWMRWILWDGYFLGENWGFCCCVGKSKRK